MVTANTGDDGAVGRWQERLQEFNFKIQHRPETKHGNADALSRRPGRRPECCLAADGTEEADDRSGTSSTTDRVNTILTEEGEARRAAAPVETVAEGMSMDPSSEESTMNLYIELTLDIEAAANSLTTCDDIVKAEAGLADGNPAKATDNVNEIDSQELLTRMREERRREAADASVSGSGELRPWSTDVTDVARKAANISGTAIDQPEGTESTISVPSLSDDSC